MIRSTAVARTFFGLTAVAVVVALTLQIPITAARTDGVFDTPAARVANLFTFFTIHANLLVAAACAVLAVAPPRVAGLGLRVLRLAGLLGIAVTGLVFHTVLAPLYTFDGAEWYANHLLHTVVPLLAVAGWVLFGPRGLVDRRVVAWSVVFPVAYLVFTLVRGALIGWYPYPFVDVIALGYGRVALNSVLVAVLFGALAAGLLGADRLLARRTPHPRGPERVGA